eukprot:754632-Prymnesium_polylepis.2
MPSQQPDGRSAPLHLDRIRWLVGACQAVVCRPVGATATTLPLARPLALGQEPPRVPRLQSLSAASTELKSKSGPADEYAGEMPLEEEDPEEPSKESSLAVARGQEHGKEQASLLDDVVIDRLINTVFRKHFGMVGDDVDQPIIERLLGQGNEDYAERMFADIEGFMLASQVGEAYGAPVEDCVGEGASRPSVPITDLIAYIREKAPTSPGLMVALNATSLLVAVDAMAAENAMPKAGHACAATKVSSLVTLSLEAIVFVLMRLGFMMIAMVLPDISKSQSTEESMLESLEKLAQDLSFDLSTGTVNAASIFGAISSVGAPSLSMDIASSFSAISSLMKGTALDPIIEELHVYHGDLEDEVRQHMCSN